MDQLDSHDDIWSSIWFHVHIERDLRSSFTEKESEASPERAG
jgi:hypothetical protein